jgi:hypothetical protein
LGYHATGPGTSFALVRAVNGWGDYFFDDKKEFDGTNQELFVPSVPASTLYPFRLLPKFTETSLVNLALASGLLGYALGIEGTLPSCPATGQGTYTFDFRPHSAIDVCYSHLNGQVEIDAVFTARRAGVETLFVVEAKASNELRQIAKHKLLYPVLSLKDRVPVNMTICPVYLRAVRRPGGLHFYIAEIEHEDGMHLNELNVRRRRHLVLEGMID